MPKKVIDKKNPLADAADPDCEHCGGIGASYYPLADLPSDVRQTLHDYAPLHRRLNRATVLLACSKCAHQAQAHGARPRKRPRAT